MPFKIDKKMKKSQSKFAKNSEFSTEITVLKFSKCDTMLAAGHADALGHIFSIIYEDDDPNSDNIDVVAWEYEKKN